MNFYKLSEETLDATLGPCPTCKERLLVVSKSPCTDPSCCGIEHSVRCDRCDYYMESENYDLSELVEKHL